MLQRALVIGLSAAGFASANVLGLMLRERWKALRWLTASTAMFLIEYIVVSAPLFLIDQFTVARTLIAQTVLNALLICAVASAVRGRRGWIFGTIDWDIQDHVIPIVLTIIALALSCANFGFFGMGQDEGVYQIRAIDLMNGKTKTIYHFDEFERLETKEQKDWFVDGTRNKLSGLYSIQAHGLRNCALDLPSFVNEAVRGEADEAEAIYHALPTFPAVLALFGIVGGSYSHMMDAQTVFFMLCVLLLWFISENLKLKKSSSMFVCLLFMLSPQSIWLSKSALTEMGMALILCLFLYLITDPVYMQRRWWSALLVTAYACWHMTIYVIYPLFILTFVVLFLNSRDRQYLIAIVCASLGYTAGMLFMTAVSPYYVLFNLGPIMRGLITFDQAWWVAMAMGIAGLMLPIPLLWTGLASWLQRFLLSRRGNMLFRAVIIAFICWTLVNILRGARVNGIREAVTTNGLYVFLWLTGLFAIPVSIVWLMKQGSRSLTDGPVAVITCMFLYMVLLMTAVFIPLVSYAYYYSRYFGPYVPVVSVATGIAINHMSLRKICAGFTISAVAMLPFDGVLLTNNDDTFCSFDAVDRITDAISADHSAVVFATDDFDMCRLFYLPIKATGVDCYFQENDSEAQITWLTRSYNTLYFIGRTNLPKQFENHAEIRLMEYLFADDNISNRLPFCPLPCGINSSTWEIPLYRHTFRRTFSAGVLPSFGKMEDGHILLNNGEIQYGPYIWLGAGSYRVEIKGQGLLNASFRLTGNAGREALPFEIIEQTDSSVVYAFTLDHDEDNVEFLTIGEYNEPTAIFEITLIEGILDANENRSDGER